MEKRRPHYDLTSLKRQMNSVDRLILTSSAQKGIKSARMSLLEAWIVVQELTVANFYKSMTVYADHRVWQDVYYADWKGKSLYIKFQRHEEYFIVSFKERDDD
jgi:motility quorum-sensing regulator/GCU-specific mRNA interferase toxin